MPKGVYIRKPLTEQHKKAISEGRLRSPKAQRASRETIKKATQASRKVPRTQRQIEACRQNGRKNGLASKGKCKPYYWGRVFAEDIVKHHNDLCHGAERPDDITLMTMREHSRLHANLRIEDGTYHFLSQNRELPMTLR